MKMLAKRFLITFGISAAMLTTPILITAAENDQCSKEMLMSYFPESFVSKTLEKFKVPQGPRAAIAKELAEKDQQVVSMVEERAGKMNPNPLKDPKLRQEAVKIFRDTLYELFAGVMKSHGVNDKDEIQAMLDDLQQQKARQFAACMDLHQKQAGDNSTVSPNAIPIAPVSAPVPSGK